MCDLSSFLEDMKEDFNEKVLDGLQARNLHGIVNMYLGIPRRPFSWSRERKRWMGRGGPN